MKKPTKTQDKKKAEKTEAPQQVVIPQWVLQPHLYQSLLLQWFETIHKDFQELGSILERIEKKISEE